MEETAKLCIGDHESVRIAEAREQGEIRHKENDDHDEPFPAIVLGLEHEDLEDLPPRWCQFSNHLVHILINVEAVDHGINFKFNPVLLTNGGSSPSVLGNDERKINSLTQGLEWYKNI